MKTTHPISLDVIRIASPCPMKWEDMSGDSRVRHCQDCQLNVYNLSDMTRDEAEQLVQQREGRLCVHYYQRRDGTILTRDCPVGISALRRRLARTVAATVALLTVLIGGAAFGKSASQVNRSTYMLGPLERFAQWLQPEVPIAGEICIPAPPPAPPAPPVPPAGGTSTISVQ